MVTSRDAEFMARALFLAERGAGRTAPNPIVGAVVVTAQGVVVGQGAHLLAGGPHAEVVALGAAGERARGATLYCTLEPCAHTGRTGPCVERIAAAGVSRVVSATRDRNPRVQGRGLAFLLERGIEVVEGVGEADAVRQNAPFFSWVGRRRPHVTVKAAVSRDGFVGLASDRVYLTGPVANRYLHRERAAVDAIAVGSGTVLVDDPQLTVRLAFRAKPLIRVIFDGRMRVPPTARVFSTLAAGPVIIVVSSSAARARREDVGRLEANGAVVEVTESRDLAPVLVRLAGRDVMSLLVEGGPHLHTAFFSQGLVDRVQRVTTPRVLDHGVAAAPGIAAALAGNAGVRQVPLGEDELWEVDVHRTD
jgi:diaminohydroxyphosphoribosylaminopyrimidine deaminase/5-amino-6-(5-phosphoribosylamino)uracil reductase